VALGVDVAEETKGLDIVVLDADREVLASAGGLSVAELARIVLEEIRPDVVCIDSPPGWSSSGKSRAGERALAALGISAFYTGADPGPHRFYRWMRVGFSVYDSIAPSYQLFREGSPMTCAAEVFPEASAVLLAGRLRSVEETKVSFRRRVLRLEGVDESGLSSIDRVDAALAALTGVRALEGTFSCLGDPAEGVIIVPVSPLPASRLVRDYEGHVRHEAGA
jgi:predicted nuclease with RNAse H fold